MSQVIGTNAVPQGVFRYHYKSRLSSRDPSPRVLPEKSVNLNFELIRHNMGMNF